jgi:hypothetical protein
MKNEYVPTKEMVFIPILAEKGDCPFCRNGVLCKDYSNEKEEEYYCDVCDRVFIERRGKYRLDWRDKRPKNRFFIYEEMLDK